MPSVADALNAKPPLGAELAAAVKDLSANQEISFALYQRYVFPLDGMNYWLRVPSAQSTVTTAGLRLRAGLATMVKAGGEAVQVAPGGLGASKIVGGVITNPLDVADQGIDFPHVDPQLSLFADPKVFPDPDATPAESIFVDFTGPASCSETATTTELQPGESIDVPAATPAWVNALTGGHQFSVVLHETVAQVSLPTDVAVEGSFHYDSMTDQRADATVDSNTVVFTSLSEIQPFNQIGPDFLYIGSYRDIRFAFASRGYLYEQADLYHYVGKAIYSVTATQIIDDVDTFNPEVFNSDSIPIWMYLNYYEPPYPGGFTCPFPLYPAFLVDDNLPPPFGAVNIDRTEALAPIPLADSRWRTTHLCRDRVTIHMYGVNNDMASDFRDFIEQYSKDWSKLGIATAGAITDMKHIQPELKVIAQRKSITFDVNYLQSVSRDMARQYIIKARCNFYPAIPELGYGVNPYATDDLSAAVPG
jgi:hypothetical protein